MSLPREITWGQAEHVVVMSWLATISITFSSTGSTDDACQLFYCHHLQNLFAESTACDVADPPAHGA